MVRMSNLFFEKPILNSPYDYPSQHWELDETGQPTQKVIEARRQAEFITPIPKPKKRKAKDKQGNLDMGHEVSSEEQQYHSAIINGVRAEVDKWRAIPNPNDWGVTPETARLLQHWRHHDFSGVRPFFCQVEAVETAIWLTEVAPNKGKTGEMFLQHLSDANEDANPGVMRLALKLATAADTVAAFCSWPQA
jgi:type III restriction enzyme